MFDRVLNTHMAVPVNLNSENVRKLRGVFRTLSNIKHEGFAKIVNGL